MTLQKTVKNVALALMLAGGAMAQSSYSLPSEAQIDARVSKAKAHLQQTEGGKLLWESIEAHGGLGRWFSNGLLKFRWVYNMTDKGAKVDTTQIIDTWSSRAVHTVNGGKEKVTFGWDGKEAWSEPKDAKIMPPPIFWALTPYYFVGVPHVLADPGTKHVKLPETIAFQGKDYDQVKVTYEQGTGESPEDYYIVLIDKDSHLVKAVRYIVTSKVVTNGKPSPEKMLTYEGWHDLSGVLFPTSHDSYKMTGNTVGEKIRYAEVSEAEFLGQADVSFSDPAKKD